MICGEGIVLSVVALGWKTEAEPIYQGQLVK